MTICPYCGSNESKYIEVRATWEDEEETIEERVYQCKDCLEYHTKFWKLEEIDNCALIRKMASKRY